MSLLTRLFGEKQQRAPLEPLYRAVVAYGRDPGWYRDGQVPDTVDGRFQMIAALMTLVLLRLEREGEAMRKESVLLTELFIEDMEASLRQIGIGDYVVGKHVGRAMSALGGRLGVFREEISGGGDFAAPVRRNIFHEAPPSPEAVMVVAERLRRFHQSLEAGDVDMLMAGRLVRP